MTELEDWIATASSALGVSDPVDVDLLLDLSREVAHAVVRPAAPVTAYLLGLAVARGTEPATAAAALRNALTAQ